MADVLLTKQSSAHRLILAAIAMFEREDDPLATFVVASAAYSALRELVKVRGESYQTSIVRVALHADAKRRVLELPELLPQDPYLSEIVEQVASGIRSGAIVGPDDVPLVLSSEDERALIRHQTGPFNFLKHADKDPLGSLNEDDVDPLGAIVGALAAYSRLFPAETLPPEVPAFLHKHGIIDPIFATP